MLPYVRQLEEDVTRLLIIICGIVPFNQFPNTILTWHNTKISKSSHKHKDCRLFHPPPHSASTTFLLMPVRSFITSPMEKGGGDWVRESAGLMCLNEGMFKGAKVVACAAKTACEARSKRPKVGEERGRRFWNCKRGMGRKRRNALKTSYAFGPLPAMRREI